MFIQTKQFNNLNKRTNIKPGTGNEPVDAVHRDCRFDVNRGISLAAGGSLCRLVIHLFRN